MGSRFYNILLSMKNKYLIFVFCMLFLSGAVNAQIEKVIVETYYISDTLDVTDTIDGAARTLPVGSKTYRVYLDLKPGFKLVKIFGDLNHALKISSTANFFNNIDRPTEYFGYQIGSQYFKRNPTLALDSWLTLGKAAILFSGILKPQDPDGSLINPSHTSSWGGTAGISTGLLINNDPAAGISITNKDGLVPSVTYTNSFNDNGFRNSSGDTTVFGATKIGSQFVSNNSYLQQTSGVAGANIDSNQVLVAQLTTLGDLSFELNVELMDTTVVPAVHYFYVAQSSTADSYVLNPFLTYPPSCGCRDIRYLEYNPTFACGDSTYCSTLKVYGCTDTAACNYDPHANVLLSNFCCYPGYCNDRDLSLVCPGLHPRFFQEAMKTNIYPNPVQNYLTLELVSSTDDKAVAYKIYDAFDRVVVEKDLGVIPGNSIIEADVSDLPKGFYLFRVMVEGIYSTKKFIKN
jgi:hypothetical protein